MGLVAAHKKSVSPKRDEEVEEGGDDSGATGEQRLRTSELLLATMLQHYFTLCPAACS